MNKAIIFHDIIDAVERLRGVANRTPVLTSRVLNELSRQQVYLKCENFQRGGAFKFRGAYNALSKLSEEERKRGVIAFSSGNHAQGLALACKILGVQATIVMPEDTPEVKIEAVQNYGGNVLFFDRYKESRERIAARYSEEHGMAIIPPFDHPDIIAGAGTAAYELMQEHPFLEHLVTPVGGGGLISGTALAGKGMNPRVKIHGVEPEGADDVRRSMLQGERVRIDPPNTIADGLRTQQVGERNFPIIQQMVHEVVTVSEEEIEVAMRFAMVRLKIVIEPSSAVALAAVMFRKFQIEKGSCIGVILSGGNVEL
ncbi:pyridoxal-phosphate dependent enzyme [Thermoactinomyces sp. DSM 45892]|uniref:pyridoxal-phosphate dependent enzyme n=1 Tax=Thermoactinomyces sp. DSM 45892 TaxID=1882753 RepID=UPI000894FE04|nr:pyridoxal-phosphate dependent enzyme [Thermoactinomyces sp. DSM 45892]SDY78203.1 threonine dehydratase [Thermoactinomyces sp. DSM 45892]